MVDNRAIAEAEELVEETVVAVEVNQAAELEVASPTLDSTDQAQMLKNELKL